MLGRFPLFVSGLESMLFDNRGIGSHFYDTRARLVQRNLSFGRPFTWQLFATSRSFRFGDSDGSSLLGGGLLKAGYRLSAHRSHEKDLPFEEDTLFDGFRF